MEKYLVLDDDDNLDFFIKVKEDGCVTTYKMFRSNADHWTDSSKGVKLLTVVDNNMNISIKMHENKFKNHQYHQTMELRILLNFINDQSSMSDNYKVVKS